MENELLEKMGYTETKKNCGSCKYSENVQDRLAWWTACNLIPITKLRVESHGVCRYWEAETGSESQ